MRRAVFSIGPEESAPCGYKQRTGSGVFLVMVLQNSSCMRNRAATPVSVLRSGFSCAARVADRTRGHPHKVSQNNEILGLQFGRVDCEVKFLFDGREQPDKSERIEQTGFYEIEIVVDIIRNRLPVRLGGLPDFLL